jgi:hypothetical protein
MRGANHVLPTGKSKWQSFAICRKSGLNKSAETRTCLIHVACASVTRRVQVGYPSRPIARCPASHDMGHGTSQIPHPTSHVSPRARQTQQRSSEPHAHTIHALRSSQSPRRQQNVHVVRSHPLSLRAQRAWPCPTMPPSLLPFWHAPTVDSPTNCLTTQSVMPFRPTCAIFVWQ